MDLLMRLLESFSTNPGRWPRKDDSRGINVRATHRVHGLDVLAAKYADQMLNDQHALIYN